MRTEKAIAALDSRRVYLTRVLAAMLDVARGEQDPERRSLRLKACALNSEELDALGCALDALREKLARDASPGVR
jgi:hypothetical protein